jgi:hypothetical protein
VATDLENVRYRLGEVVSSEAYEFYHQYNYQERPFNDPNGYKAELQNIDMGKIYNLVAHNLCGISA